jgi:uncharacterized protein
VLRYDKRSRVHPFSFVGKPFTVREEVVDDALAAVALLRATPGIDPARIVVAGHSLGGMLAPRIAAADSGIAGLVVLAGPTRPLLDVIDEQLAHLARQADTGDGQAAAQRAAQRAAMAQGVARVRALTPADSASPAMILGAPAPYWLDLRDYHPAEAARSLRRPMLILQGGRDYQVTAADLQGWRDALGDRKDVTIREYPDLNHLFISGTGPGTPAEYAVPGRVADRVLDDIAAWVGRIGAPRASSAARAPGV